MAKKQEIKQDTVNLRFSAIDGQSYNPTLAVERDVKGSDYVSWGEDNNYPDYLFDTVNNCATLQAIINGSVNYTIGDGIINNTNIKGENRFGETLEDVVEKMIVDRWIFGGWTPQLVYNALGEKKELCYLDMRRVRTDRTGKNIFVYDNWSGYGCNRADRFHSFNPDTGKEDKLQICYYKGNKTRGVYPIPDYSAAIVSAETQIEIQKFNYNEIVNNFLASFIINFNNGEPTDPIKKQIEKSINEKFSGAKNAGRFFVSFNDDKDSAVTVDRLGTDDLDKRYSVLSDSTRANLFISLNAMPILFGLQDSTGFNKQEYRDALALYLKTAVAPKQKEIQRFLNKILSGTYPGENAIEFNSFNVEFSE